MNDDDVFNVLLKLTGMYNKNLSAEQSAPWIQELRELNQFEAYQTLKRIKTEKHYEKTMPTIPQFLSIYKTFLKVENINNEFCFVCFNRGVDVIRICKEINGKTVIHDYAMHCDCCKFGKTQAIVTKSGKSLPISEYFDINERIRINKARYYTSQKSKEKEQMGQKAIKLLYKSLAMG